VAAKFGEFIMGEEKKMNGIHFQITLIIEVLKIIHNKISDLKRIGMGQRLILEAYGIRLK